MTSAGRPDNGLRRGAVERACGGGRFGLDAAISAVPVGRHGGFSDMDTVFEIGDLVVLNSGSMRMAVESVEEGRVACVWCHEGQIGRDTFSTRLLKKWEHREDEARAPRGDRDGGPKPYRGDREGGGKPFRPSDREDRPRKTGWDGKPREKKFFRKDG